ncbi:MAG: glycosyltransferase family 2 protein [Halopenitus sp.]
MKVSGIFTVRNAIEAGYPFVESILSVKPAVDEFLVNDGGSDDGTLDVLMAMEDEYDKIELHQIDDFKSENWECIDHQISELIDRCSGDWIFESQADEIYHEDDIREILQLIQKCDEVGYNSIRQPRESITAKSNEIGAYTYHTVRIVRNLPDLETHWGGDDFRIGAPGTSKYSSHHVPPEYESTIPFYHYNRAFEEQSDENKRRHAEWLATQHHGRQESYTETSNDN